MGTKKEPGALPGSSGGFKIFQIGEEISQSGISIAAALRGRGQEVSSVCNDFPVRVTLDPTATGSSLPRVFAPAGPVAGGGNPLKELALPRGIEPLF